jgi:hypothetical protein
MNTTLKYCSTLPLIVIGLIASAQQNNYSNQAVVTIVGNAGDDLSNGNDFDLNGNQSNPYSQNAAPPQQAYQSQTVMLIEPTLENGFHTRMQVGSSQQAYERNSTPSYSGEARKHKTSLSERSFNFKKRFKSWMPKRKKRYRPHLCGRF